MTNPLGTTGPQFLFRAALWCGALLAACGGSRPTPNELAAPSMCSGDECLQVGASYLEAGDVRAALLAYEDGCTQRSAASCLERGRVASDQNRGDALENAGFIHRGCELGSAEACMLEGASYEETDPDQAMAAYRRACTDTEQAGCARLGHLAELKLRTDAASAVRDLDVACGGGNARACFDLGVVLLAGRFNATDFGIPEDLIRARRSFVTSCEGGYTGGCENLAVMMATGSGGPEDFDNARRLATPSCEGGHEPSCQVLREISRVEAVRAARASAPEPPVEAAGSQDEAAEPPPADEPPPEAPGPRYSTHIQSMEVNGASFRDVDATCGAFQLMGVFQGLRQHARRCVRGARTATLTLSLEGGRVQSVSGGDDAGSRCAVRALQRKTLGGATCQLRLTMVD